MPDGEDYVQLGSPLLHSHPSTKAEGMTRSLSSISGGGELAGSFTDGRNDRVSWGRYHMMDGTSLLSGVPVSETLTYPLYGQNVLDWRDPRKAHNNIPPSTNIFVRFKARTTMAAPLPPTPYPEAVRGRPMKSAGEMEYVGTQVKGLDTYVLEDLTDHDCLLRIVQVEGG